MSAVGKNAASVLLTVACSYFYLISSWYEHCVLWSALIVFLQKLLCYWNMENV